ncbi:hypothetical protein [Mesobacillus zeae]|uniref:hypothetical protein n=1 Tax=Mesobacillus zeae TaxID=1917180 RepID=UPI003009AC52
MTDLRLKNEPQLVNYNLYEKYSPVSMECWDGELIVPDEYGEKQGENLLLLLIYNIGIQRTLEIIEENKEDNP